MEFKFENQDTGEIYGQWEFNPSQERFWESRKKFVLFSGGYGCGKSLMLTLKAVDFALKYPGNYILMGRKTYPELRDTLLKEFFVLCPDILIKDYLKAEGRVIFHNKSEIVFRHLDTVAASEIRSMNLGAAFIDQAEDIEKEVFDGLRGRLRREGVPDEDRKIYLSCNPALTWLFAEFKQNPQPEYEVIEASTLENEKNLPKGYVEDLLKYPESYKKQYVYGVWDLSLLSDNTVFPREYIERLIGMQMPPKREFEGLKIYKEHIAGHDYQMGIDPAEGIEAGDWSVISIVDITEEEEVAHFAGKVPPGPLAEKAKVFAKLYSDKNKKCLIIPEMNSIGSSLVMKLQENMNNEYRLFKREEYDKTTKMKTEKIGWRTTSSTKPMLVTRFQELLRLRSPRIYTVETIEQFKSFVWTDDANKKGMGAKQGFHDDRVIATLLAFWRRGPVVEGSVFSPNKTTDNGIIVKNGKITIPQLVLEKEKHKSWMTT